MPLRAYQPLKPPCRLCGNGFELVQAAREPVLSKCPRCGADVKLCDVAQLHTPKVLKPLSVSDAKTAGFTVLRRTSTGEYEKQ